jgi:DNA-3-methyladenine glycosylase
MPPGGDESQQRRLILPADFFSRPALVVARELIGKFLVRRVAEGDVEIAGLIHETEAYVGPHDLACHASKGCTARTQVMFGPAGFWYVYLIYGIHWMLNVVTDGEDYPSAVLIRGVGNWDGPGKLTKTLAIDKKLNGRPASPASGLWIEDRGYRPPRRRVQRTPRIGVDCSGDWAAKPYRFILTPQFSMSQSATDLPRSASKVRRR